MSTSLRAAGDDREVRDLYQRLLGAWNAQNADAYAAVMTPNANLVGFDGSQMDGREAIRVSLAEIFAHHATGRYVSIVREVRALGDGVMLLRAIVGMISPGQTDLNPAVNAVQSLVAVRTEDGWRITLFHNTPAALHGRPELQAQMTNELRATMRPPAR